MPKVIISEKPSVAADISNALGGLDKKDGWFESSDYLVTWAIGHMLELVPPEDYKEEWKKWSMKTLPIIPESFKSRSYKDKGRKKQLSTILSLIKRDDVDSIINACDAAREGERIFQEIYRHSRTAKPYKRLWLQSMTLDSIREAFQNLKSGEEMHPLRDAADCRAEADWLIGMNGTRACTVRLRQNKKRAGQPAWSVGRVQTATLAIVTDHELSILSHIPKPFWKLNVNVKLDNESWVAFWEGQGNDEGADKQLIFTDEQRSTLKSILSSDSNVTVIEERKNRNENAPLPFDLTTLQKTANRMWSWPSKKTLSVAQSLYESQKAITYPRTDSRHLPNAMREQIQNVINSLVPHTSLGVHATRLIDNGLQNEARVYNDNKVSDHFAIIPTGVLSSNLNKDETNLFILICKQFLAAFHPRSVWINTSRIATKENQRFIARQKKLEEVGWRALFPPKQDFEPWKILSPEEHVGTFSSHDFEEGLTKPKGRFTEAALLARMEGAGKDIEDESLRDVLKSTKGLGTPATRADTIEKLINRQYISRLRGNTFRATFRGIRLIETLRRVPVEWLTSPLLTGEMESTLRDVQQGKIARSIYMDEVINKTTEMASSMDTYKAQELYSDASPVASCQCSQGEVEETALFYKCEQCSFIIWKDSSGRYFDRNTVSRLLSDTKIEDLHGFFGQNDNEYTATVSITKEGISVASTSSDLAPQSVNQESLGSCSLCGEGKAQETPTHIVCTTDSCKLEIPREINKRKMSRDELQHLISNRKTPALEGFISRYGKPFSAFITLKDNGRIGYEFPPRTNSRQASLPQYDVSPGVVANCPSTDVGIVETPTHFSAESNDKGCNIEIPRNLCKRELTRSEAAILIARGEVGPFEDFTSKNNKPFTASIFLKKNGKPGYKFPPR